MEIIVMILLFLLIWAVCLCLGALILMLAWNFVIPHLFGLPLINFWQAFALSIIIGIIFGGLSRVSKRD